MKTLKEIEERLAAVEKELESSDALNAEELKALAEEVNGLFEEKKTIETRGAALKAIAAGKGIRRDAFGGGEKTDPLDTKEYRDAFMNFVCRGTPIPPELRADTFTGVSDASAAVPTALMEEIVREMKSYGELFEKVRKTNVPGGVRYPILSLKPVASWVTETAVSDQQKLQANTYVDFSFYALECRISQSLLTSVVTYDAFQREFIPLAVNALVQALEIGVIKGTGTGQMLGVVNDARVPSGNTVTMSDADFGSWAGWSKKVFAKMKKSYKNGVFVMAESTYQSWIDGMVDNNGQPTARVTFGMGVPATYMFRGREVVTVEEDVIGSYDAAVTGDVVAVFFNPDDYAVNSNLELTVKQWEDPDNNLVKTKAIIIADGKLLDPNGVLIIKKGANPSA
ncbi:MAG: phage major capsid protein [Oscillospiraceae bacterium]|jgi:HK97 family phage major capsid protein|nr:phage major capsid protein [Oscillospiraceae bacterium]